MSNYSFYFNEASCKAKQSPSSKDLKCRRISYFYPNNFGVMKYILLLFILLYSFNTFSQQIRPTQAAGIYKEINTLKRLPKVLYFAAHPDDENTGLLSWLVNQQYINTAYLSLTRGDGGQNLIGSEQGAALGLIRTHELLEARKVDGAKQLFSTAIDFGFSKNPEDTFKQWNIDSITADAVWIIRKFKPDVIITRFPPTSAAGHGQHSASAIIAAEAFKAAGDKNRYPEQLTHLDVWQPKRLVWNTFRFGSTNTTNENQFKVTVGQYDPLLGMGYGELAGVSRSLHQSQGAGTPSVAGTTTEYFTSVLGEPIINSLFDGIKLNWTDLQRSDIDQAIDLLIEQYDFLKPDLSIPNLLNLRKLIRTLNDEQLKKEKLSAIDHIILSAAGFMAEMITNKSEALAGEELNFQLNIISRSTSPLSIQKIQLPSDVKELNTTLNSDSLTSFNFQITIPNDAEIAEPYWLKYPQKSASQYNVKVDSLIGLPLRESPLNAKLTLYIQDESFEVSVPFSYKKLDPIKGDVVEPLRIIPDVNIKFSQSLFFQKEGSPIKLGVNIYSHKNITNGILTIKNNDQILSSLKNINLSANTDTTIEVLINSDKTKNFSNAMDNSLKAILEVSGKLYNKNQELIRYNHIPTLQYFTPANTRLMSGDLKVKAHKIGYIQGAGDFIPDFLRMAGIEVTILNDNDFSNAKNLAEFDAIIAGIRVINVEKRMPHWMSILNQYIHDGGTLIMQFNTLQDMSTTKIGPYPFTIGRDRVTEETAEVQFLDPNHPLLNYPNKITTSDFQGWVQEMGLYFPTSWDKQYIPLFEMHDTGEEALTGSTLYTSYGKGHFIYTSLSFFRQLPMGNKGAAKLFFNMISIGKNEKKKL